MTPMRRQFVRHVAAHGQLPSCHRTYGGYDLGCLGVLEHIPSRSRLHGRHYIRLVVVRSQHEHPYRQLLLLHPGRHVNPAGVGHPHIQDSDIGLVFLDQRFGRGAICCLRQNRHVWFFFQKVADTFAHNGMVICQNNAYCSPDGTPL